jgi:hypothetical protein
VISIASLKRRILACRKRAQLRKLMTTYCARQGFAENSVVFLYDGVLSCTVSEMGRVFS